MVISRAVEQRRRSAAAILWNKFFPLLNTTTPLLHGATAIICLLVASCGYTVQGWSVPASQGALLEVRSISIDQIINRTYEPGIDDRMRDILAQELIKRGFKVDRSSGYKIYGSINTFELRTLSEKAGVAVEYEVVVNGDFKLRSPSGMVRDLRSGGPFIVSFLSADRLQDVMALREKAIEKALRDLSQELIISIHEP